MQSVQFQVHTSISVDVLILSNLDATWRTERKKSGKTDKPCRQCLGQLQNCTRGAGRQLLEIGCDETVPPGLGPLWAGGGPGLCSRVLWSL